MTEFSSANVDVTSYKTAYLDPSVTILNGDVDEKNIDLYLYAVPSGVTGRGLTTIYNAKLERGNAVTGFTNAPEDNLYAGVNLLRNGGFEMYGTHNYPIGWVLMNDGDRTEENSVHEQVVVAATDFSVCGPNTDTDTYGGFRDPAVNTCVIIRQGEHTETQRVGIYSNRVDLTPNEVYTFSGYVSCRYATKVYVNVYETDASNASPDEALSVISTNEYTPIWGNT